MNNWVEIDVPNLNQEQKKVVERGVDKARKHGLGGGLKKITDTPMMVGAPMEYSDNINTVIINPENFTQKFFEEADYDTTTNNRVDATVHECVHGKHNQVWGGYGEVELSSRDQEILKEEVSEYSSRNPKEAIAEIAVGLIKGEEYPESVRDLYRKYHGPELNKVETF